jgi:hypothetical protein
MSWNDGACGNILGRGQITIVSFVTLLDGDIGLCRQEACTMDRSRLAKTTVKRKTCNDVRGGFIADNQV